MLIVRVGAMGDVLHALPAVSSLRTQQPELEIDWVVDPRWAPLLVDRAASDRAPTDPPSADALSARYSAGGPVVSRVHLAPTRLWAAHPFSRQTLQSVLALRQAVRAPNYDAAVDMQGTLRSAVIGQFAGAERYAGYADPRERAARWLYRQAFPRQGEHVVGQGAALLGAALGVSLEPAGSVQLPRWPEAEAWAERLRNASTLAPRPFVLLAPSAGWGAKQWPAECFGLLAELLWHKGYAVLVNAASTDDPTAATVVAASLDTARTVCGGVAGLVAMTRRAALVIGGDSGPVHLAAALGTPVVALFGPTDPARNGPWGAGTICVLRHPESQTTYKRTAATEAGLGQIEVATVLRAALEAIG